MKHIIGETLTEERILEIKLLSLQNHYEKRNGNDYYCTSFPGVDAEITTVWVDRSGQHVLSDAGAVTVWGLANVINFVLGFTEWLYSGEREERLKELIRHTRVKSVPHVHPLGRQDSSDDIDTAEPSDDFDLEP